MSIEKFNNLTEANLFTSSECENILAQLQKNTSEKLLLKDFKVEPEFGTIGYLGQYFHLTLSYIVESDIDRVVRQQRLFVKTLPYNNAELCRYVIKTGILSKEITLYSTLLKELRKFTLTALWPECLYTRDDLFVMQNLKDIGYMPCNAASQKFQGNGMKSLLKGLAQMHASSIAYEVENKLNIGEIYQHALQEITVSPQESYFTTGVRAIIAVIKQHPLYQSATQQKYIEEKLAVDLSSVYDMVNPSTEYRNVFCHRDPWGGNIVFNVAKTLQNDISMPVMFLDFQTCRYCPAAIDVIFALYMNLNVQEVKDMETFYLDWYYKCFTEALSILNIAAVEHMCREEFFSSYKEFQLFGLLYRAIAATILHVPNDYLSNLKLNSPEMYYKYAYVDRTTEVLSLMDASLEFRKYMQQCVGDMINLLCGSDNEI